MKTTKKDFELFESECWKWIDFFGLKAWDIVIEHESAKGNRATCSYFVTNRSIVLNLATEFETDPITSERIKQDAFHEVCEILLCNIRTLAETRFIHKDEIDEEVHAIIRTLENVLYKG